MQDLRPVIEEAVGADLPWDFYEDGDGVAERRRGRPFRAGLSPICWRRLPGGRRPSGSSGFDRFCRAAELGLLVRLLRGGAAAVDCGAAVRELASSAGGPRSRGGGAARGDSAKRERDRDHGQPPVRHRGAASARGGHAVARFAAKREWRSMRSRRFTCVHRIRRDRSRGGGSWNGSSVTRRWPRGRPGVVGRGAVRARPILRIPPVMRARTEASD